MNETTDAKPVAGGPTSAAAQGGKAGRRPNPRAILATIAVVVVAVLIYNWIQDQRSLAAPPEGSGTVEATEIEVGPQVTARILQVFVEEGDEVKQGQIIARLDDVDLRAQLRQAVGQRDAALHTLRNLQEGSRVQQIAGARAALAQAEAAFKGAQQSLSNADLGFHHATDVRQQLDAAAAQVRALTAQDTAAQRQAAAAVAQASGAERTLGNAEESLTRVTELQQQVDNARGQLETARANHDRAVSSVATAQADFDRVSSLFAQDAVARRDFDNAKLTLDTARTGLATAESEITTARATVQNSTRALNDRLAQRGAVIAAETSRQALARQREAAEALARQVDAQLEGARLQLATAQTAYEDRLQARIGRDTAATGVKTARDQVEAARQNLSLLVAGNTEASIRAAKGQLEAAEGLVAQAKKHLTETVVRAPEDGAVSTIVSHAGEIVSSSLPVVKMLDLQHAYVRVYLPFRSFGKVKAGQSAAIDTDALPGRKFEGKVIELATEAEFTPKNVETRDQRLQQVYWVKVGITGADRRLKPGMPAHATIVQGQG